MGSWVDRVSSDDVGVQIEARQEVGHTSADETLDGTGRVMDCRRAVQMGRVGLGE